MMKLQYFLDFWVPKIGEKLNWTNLHMHEAPKEFFLVLLNLKSDYFFWALVDQGKSKISPQVSSSEPKTRPRCFLGGVRPFTRFEVISREEMDFTAQKKNHRGPHFRPLEPNIFAWTQVCSNCLQPFGNVLMVQEATELFTSFFGDSHNLFPEVHKISAQTSWFFDFAKLGAATAHYVFVLGHYFLWQGHRGSFTHWGQVPRLEGVTYFPFCPAGGMVFFQCWAVACIICQVLRGQAKIWLMCTLPPGGKAPTHSRKPPKPTHGGVGSLRC